MDCHLGRDTGGDRHKVVTISHIGDLNFADAYKFLFDTKHGDVNRAGSDGILLDDDTFINLAHQQLTRCAVSKRTNVQGQDACGLVDLSEHRRRRQRANLQRTDGEGLVLHLDRRIRDVDGTKYTEIQCVPGNARDRNRPNADRDLAGGAVIGHAKREIYRYAKQLGADRQRADNMQDHDTIAQRRDAVAVQIADFQMGSATDIEAIRPKLYAAIQDHLKLAFGTEERRGTHRHHAQEIAFKSDLHAEHAVGHFHVTGTLQRDQ